MSIHNWILPLACLGTQLWLSFGWPQAVLGLRRCCLDAVKAYVKNILLKNAQRHYVHTSQHDRYDWPETQESKLVGMSSGQLSTVVAVTIMSRIGHAPAHPRT